MFTGIIEELGIIHTITSNRIIIESKIVLEDAQLGDSIAVNGVCLTVSDLGKSTFTADVSPETLKVTNLSFQKSGSIVNLERALPVTGRFGGHIVSGHIDGTAKCTSLKKIQDFYILELELGNQELKNVVKKGSIAVNGISLTVAEIIGSYIKIAIIPHTYENTNLKTIRVGDIVNIETDIIAKYIEKFLSTSDNKVGISMDFLKENGF